MFTIDFVAGPLIKFISVPDQLRVPMFQLFIVSTILSVPAIIMGGIAYMHNEIEWRNGHTTLVNVLAGEEDKAFMFPMFSLFVTQLIMLGAYYDFKVLLFTIFSLGKG